MKNWLVGTGLVIGGSILVLLLVELGLSRQVAVGIGTAVSVGGFIIQMYSTFGMRASFERSHRAAQREHEALMKRARRLPPEQAIQLLLGNIK